MSLPFHATLSGYVLTTRSCWPHAIYGLILETTYRYTCPLVCGYGWMPDRKGVVSGVIVAGFGAGAAVFNVVATGWVNPENASPDRATGLYSEVGIHNTRRTMIAAEADCMFLRYARETCFFILTDGQECFGEFSDLLMFFCPNPSNTSSIANNTQRKR